MVNTTRVIEYHKNTKVVSHNAWRTGPEQAIPAP